MSLLNESHDPTLTSWVGQANQPGSDFPIQNLPFAVFRRKGSDEAFRGGVAIGDQIVDLGAAAGSGVFSGEAASAFLAFFRLASAAASFAFDCDSVFCLSALACATFASLSGRVFIDG
ncbi:hypothetical protein ACRXB1_26990, partial [Caballeronia sp. M23-90]